MIDLYSVTTPNGSQWFRSCWKRSGGPTRVHAINIGK
jgi:hypothetical protein